MEIVFEQQNAIAFIGILINFVLALIGWTIQRELHHIRETIDGVRSTVIGAQRTADRAHERLDEFIKDLKLFP